MPLYPSVNRDIAFILSKDVPYTEIVKSYKEASSNILKNIDIFDVYEGQHAPEGCKSVAVRLTMQDAEATLTDEGERANIQKALKRLLKKLVPIFLMRE
ncbi:MAG: hypothetical protein MZV70_76995 [Desulfobacterales bacterium]|nr:hypothetical protein [Desulfobacterales bacterium]